MARFGCLGGNGLIFIINLYEYINYFKIFNLCLLYWILLFFLYKFQLFRVIYFIIINNFIIINIFFYHSYNYNLINLPLLKGLFCLLLKNIIVTIDIFFIFSNCTMSIFLNKFIMRYQWGTILIFFTLAFTEFMSSSSFSKLASKYLLTLIGTNIVSKAFSLNNKLI